MPANSKKSVTLRGHRTSISLETEFWVAVQDFAREDGLSLNQLISQIDDERVSRLDPPNLSSAIRVYVLKRLQG